MRPPQSRRVRKPSQRILDAAESSSLYSEQVRASRLSRNQIRRRKRTPKTTEPFSAQTPASVEVSPNLQVLPRLFLWNTRSNETFPGSLRNTNTNQLVGLLQKEKNLALYVGQNIPSFPQCLSHLFVERVDLDDWLLDFRRPGVARRVMIMNPDGHLLRVKESPRIADLYAFLENANRGKPAEETLRLFMAGVTNRNGLSNSTLNLVSRLHTASEPQVSPRQELDAAQIDNLETRKRERSVHNDEHHEPLKKMKVNSREILYVDPVNNLQTEEEREDLGGHDRHPVIKSRMLNYPTDERVTLGSEVPICRETHTFEISIGQRHTRSTRAGISEFESTSEPPHLLDKLYSPNIPNYDATLQSGANQRSTEAEPQHEHLHSCEKANDSMSSKIAGAHMKDHDRSPRHGVASLEDAPSVAGYMDGDRCNYVSPHDAEPSTEIISSQLREFESTVFSGHVGHHEDDLNRSVCFPGEQQPLLENTFDNDVFAPGQEEVKFARQSPSQEVISPAERLRLLEKYEEEGGPVLQDLFSSPEEVETLRCISKIVPAHYLSEASVALSASSAEESARNSQFALTPKCSPCGRRSAFMLHDCTSSEASLQSLLEKAAPSEEKSVISEESMEVDPKHCIEHKPTYYEEEEIIDGDGEIYAEPSMFHNPIPSEGNRQERKVVRKKSSVTPIGAPHQPLSGTAHSRYVYLWNYDLDERSDLWYRLEEALRKCTTDRSGKLALYDGQDYDFDSGLRSSRAVYYKTDSPRWARRDLNYPATGSQKTRLWSRSLQALRAHRYTPITRNLRTWLPKNLDFAVFQPSFLNPTCIPGQHDSVVENIQKSFSTRAPRLRDIIRRKILPRIRQSGILQVQDEERITLCEFWDTVKNCVETRRPFRSRNALIIFLIQSPWLEVYREQNTIAQFEIEDGSKLLPLMMNCPAHIASFWDKRSEEKVIHPSKDERFIGKTVYECLAKDGSLELYLGQDTDYFYSISQNVAARHSCTFPYPYMLAHCGETVQSFFALSEWTATYLEVSNCTTAAAVFWKKSSGTIIMQPEMSSFVSVEKYLARHKGIELYMGQDMSGKLREEVSHFFEILSFTPGYSRHTHKPAVTKCTFLPVSVPVANLRFSYSPALESAKTDGEHHGSVGPYCSVQTEQRCGDNQHRASEHRMQDTVMSDEVETLEPILSKEKQDLAEAVVVPGDILEESGTITPENDENLRSAPSRDTTNCSEENLDELSVAPSSPSLVTNAAQDPGLYEDSSDSDCTMETCDRDETGKSCTKEERLRKAKESSNRAAQLIKEAGPKILNRMLVLDLRQSLREDLILEVASVEDLVELSKGFRSLDFITAADELCKSLEDLDVYKCFTDVPDFGQEAPDLSWLRVGLESGLIFTVSGIVREFRYISEDLIRFHQDGALLNEAILLKFNGEKAVTKFLKQHYVLVTEEKRLTRIAALCEKARKIGFRVNENRNRTKRTSSLTLRRAKPVIRVSGYQSEVTFLNYRDEKGHSMMGKRHSARVFGVSIDRKTCESKIGNVRTCHICDKKVFESDGDALKCLNASIGLCDVVACRKCLEVVFFYGEKEFVENRQANNWLCVHCSGLCGSNRKCKGSNSRREVLQRDILLEWHCNDESDGAYSAKLSRRSMSGEFESWDDALGIDFVINAERSSCSAAVKVRVGLYRCKIALNGQWHASSTFLVLESDMGSSTEHSKRSMTGEHVRGSQEESSGSITAGSGKRLIRWKVSKREVSNPVHTFATGEGGAMIDRCSRTEGYDWRRSKRHTVVQWIPQQMEGNSMSVDKPQEKRMKVVLSASSAEAQSCIERGSFPEIHVGMSYDVFQKAVNAHRFDHMVSETLWGIVAGKSGIHGIGLFSLTGYRKGDFVIEYAGELIRSPLADLREARYDAEGLGTYFFRIDELQIVDATVKSNRARFTNHSCDPNMSAKIAHVRGRDLVVLLATRDIPPFSELTFNYQLPYEDKKLQCLCNSWNCVGVMN